MKKLRNAIFRVLYRVKLWFLRKITAKTGGVYYIGGSDTLPPPLSHEDEAELIGKLAEAIESGDTGENIQRLRRTLVERNLRLVVYIAKKFDNTGIGIEDLISIGTIGLMKAIKTFAPSKNIKLATYASRCIENEILMFIRKTGNLRGEMSIDEPLSVDWDGNELLLSDVLYLEDEGISRSLDREEDRKLICSALRGLGERERRIIVLRFGLGGIIGEEEREKFKSELPNLPMRRLFRENTQKEVAELLGISQSYISRLEKRILGELKNELAASL